MKDRRLLVPLPKKLARFRCDLEDCLLSRNQQQNQALMKYMVYQCQWAVKWLKLGQGHGAGKQNGTSSDEEAPSDNATISMSSAMTTAVLETMTIAVSGAMAMLCAM